MIFNYKPVRFLYPFLAYAEYSDGTCLYASGENEVDAFERLGNQCEQHGDLTLITGVEDENYSEGERI